MKKIILITVLSLILSACSNSNDKSQDSANSHPINTVAIQNDEKNEFDQYLVGTWIPIGGSGDFYLYSNENLHIMSDGTCYEGLANSITDNIVGGTIQKITYKTKTEGNTWNFFQAKINKTMDELLEPSNDLVRENYYSEDEIDFIKRTEFNTIYQITNATCEEVEK